MAKASDITGQRFHKLIAEKIAVGVKPRSWVCACDCGGSIVAVTGVLLSGVRKSCGCLRRAVLGDRTRTHGMANSRTTGYVSRAYGVWQAMRDRCKNANRKDYYRYGGRGITVCMEWDDSFEVFLEEMGEPPVGMTLDRIDNDGPYCKSNCRWASRKEQVYNSTQVRLITVDGITRPLRAWLDLQGITRGSFYYQLKQGRKPEQILRGEK